MGLTVLYVAFSIVALWLLGEVLLQYKARLRWRLLAFGGFLTVVLGMLVASRVVIALGAVAFAVGQTYVTLSFRRGFSTGWALGGKPGASRRRRGGAKDDPPAPGEGAEPPFDTGAAGAAGAEGASGIGGFAGAAGERRLDDDFAHDGTAVMAAVPGSDAPAVHDVSAAEPTAMFPEGVPGDPSGVYEPQPMPDDTGQYGVYDDPSFAPAGAGARQEYADRPGAGQDYAPFDGGYDPLYAQQPAAAPDAGYDYGQAPQQYPAYSDPYVGGQQYAAGYEGELDGYDSFGNPRQYAGDPYYGQQQPYTDTPPGGVWVPQPRDPETPGQQPGPDGLPYDQGYGNEPQQYRY
ncbi:hypothetical protein [Streptomyces sp. NPDC047315]|uniref:hypothetical protein n=1 Tax=Streptomyces sp. NPDC047315 TaxID=3155142 RepID=UPI0033D3B857